MDEPRTISTKELTEAARLEFRRYGFRADGPGKFSSGKEPIRIIFEEEAATGQAAFSQYAVTPHVRVWSTFGSEGTIPLGVNGQLCLDLCVSYTHVGGGCNGYDVRYSISKCFDDEPPMLKRLS